MRFTAMIQENRNNQYCNKAADCKDPEDYESIFYKSKDHMEEDQEMYRLSGIYGDFQEGKLSSCEDCKRRIKSKIYKNRT